jgi:FdhD protein
VPLNIKQPIRVAAIDAIDGDSRIERNDYVVVEEPLAIRVGVRDTEESTSLAITMRTPGHDEELAAGLVFTEGLVHHRSDIREIEARPHLNEVIVRLDGSVKVDDERLRRNLYMSSSCGVCGKATIEALFSTGQERLTTDATFSRELIHKLPEATRAAQSTFEHTGALHAATLFDCSGRLRIIREDVGRHNALDKIIGAEFLAGRSMESSVVMLSGRVGFELVQKCVVARVPVMAAVGAPSSLAIETARRFNVTLLGFVRDNRFNIYTGSERIV